MQERERWARVRRGLGVAWVLALVQVFLLALPGHAKNRGADGEYDRRSSSHFVLFQDVDIDVTHGLRGSRRFEQEVLATLERAYRKLDETLGLRPDGPLVVTVHDPAIFDQRFAGLFRFSAAGFYSGTIHIRGDVQVHESLVRVLHHELVHAALHAEAPGLVLPAWLNEGLAEWFEQRSRGKRRLAPWEAQALGSAGQAGVLPVLADLAAPSLAGFGPQAAQLAYLESYAFVEFLVRHHGERSLEDLIDQLFRSRDLDRAIRRVCRADLEKLETRFRAEWNAAR